KNVDNLQDALKVEKAKLKNAKKIIDKHSNKLKDINKDIRSITYKIQQQRIQHWKENRVKIKENIEVLKDPKIIALLTKDLDAFDEEKRRAATDRILSLSALVYKSYMDDLYYSGEYRKPKNAAI